MKKVLLLLGVLLFVQYEATAQINPIRRAQRKIEDRLAKKAADKIEEAIDKKIDEKEKENQKDKDKQDKSGEKNDQPGYDLSKIMGTGEPVDLPDAYEFNFQIDWVITSSESDKPTEMTQLFSEDKLLIGMEFVQEEKKGKQEKMQMVIDIEKSYMVMLNEKESQAMVLQMDNLEATIEDQLDKEAEKMDQDFSLTKTSETKTIAGYLCTKYVYTGKEKEKGEMWATEQLSYDNIDMYSYFRRMAQKKNYSQQNPWNKGIEGYVLEIISTDDKGRETHMYATKVDPNSNRSFNIEGYQSMDLRGYSKMMNGSKN